MVYLLQMVIFHGKLLNNQMVTVVNHWIPEQLPRTAWVRLAERRSASPQLRAAWGAVLRGHLGNSSIVTPTKIPKSGSVSCSLSQFWNVHFLGEIAAIERAGDVTRQN